MFGHQLGVYRLLRLLNIPDFGIPPLDLLVTETVAKFWFRLGSDFFWILGTLWFFRILSCVPFGGSLHTLFLGINFLSLLPTVYSSFVKVGVSVYDCSRQSEYSCILLL